MIGFIIVNLIFKFCLYKNIQLKKESEAVVNKKQFMVNEQHKNADYSFHDKTLIDLFRLLVYFKTNSIDR